MKNQKRKLIFGIKNYFKPTPKNIKILGDSLLTISTSLGTCSIIMDHKILSIVVIILGLIGKILTNMFTEK